jgi:hypothetical protein
MPRILGVPMAIAGLCWLTYLSPQLANYFSRYILAFVLVLEGLVFLWFLVMGEIRHRAVSGIYGLRTMR